MPTFTGTAGPDTFVGGADSDTFNFAPADLTAADTVTGGGGAGVDTLGLTAAGTVPAANLAGVSGIERIAYSQGAGLTVGVTVGDAFAAANPGPFSLTGGPGNDQFDASAVTLAGFALTVYDGGGNDTYLGGAGNDTFHSGTGIDAFLGGAGDDTFYTNNQEMTPADVFSGGDGFDTMSISVVNFDFFEADLSNVSGMERFALVNGVQLTFDNAIAAANAAVVEVIGSSSGDHVWASAVTDPGHSFDFSSGGGGVDAFVGGVGDDVFRFTHLDLRQNDFVVGNDGMDTLTLSGPGGTLTAHNLDRVYEIERFNLAPGVSNEIFVPTTLASNVIGRELTINANGATNADIDASALIDPARAIRVDFGTTPDPHGQVVGGAGDDAFVFQAGTVFTDPADGVNGGAGQDRIVLTGTGTQNAFSSVVQSIEVLEIASAGVEIGFLVDMFDEIVISATVDLTGVIIDNYPIITLAADVDLGAATITGISTIVAAQSVTILGAPPNADVLIARSESAFGTPISEDVTVSMTSTQLAAFDTLSANEFFVGQSSEIFAIAMDSASLDLSALVTANFDSRDRIQVTGTGGNDTVIGSGFADLLIGGDGDDMLAGGNGNDTLFAGGGSDALHGGSDVDVLYVGANLTSGDAADGGDGRDAIVLQGNYAYALSAGNLVNLESISVQSGANTRWGDTANNFYDYDLTMHDANVAAGQQMIVNAQSLRVGENFIFRGLFETDGSFLVYAGHGADVVVGGAGNDVFFFEGTRWGSSDVVFGGAGSDAVLLAAGSGLNVFDFSESSFFEIESISVNNRFATDPSQVPTYELILANGNVTPGGSLIVNGNSLAANQTFEVDGSAVTDGRLNLFGGAADDILVGGGSHDTLFGGLGVDQLTGGAGNDVFRYDDIAHSLPSGRDTINDFALGDAIDLSRIDANSLLAGDQAFSFIGTAAFSDAGAASAGELRVQFLAGSTWLVQGDTDGNGTVNFVVEVSLSDADPLTAADFVL